MLHLFGKRQAPLADYFSFTDAIEGGKTIPGGRDFTLFPPINQTSTDHVSPFREIGNGPLPTIEVRFLPPALMSYSHKCPFCFATIWLFKLYIKWQACYSFEVKYRKHINYICMLIF